MQILKQSQDAPIDAESETDTIITANLQLMDLSELNILINQLETVKENRIVYGNFLDSDLFFFFLDDSQGNFNQFKSAFSNTNSLKVAPNRKDRPASYTPNDPFYSQQWNLSNISWPQAMQRHFNLGETENEVVIALIDNGTHVDLTDLSGSIWVNEAETENNSDSDGNGYIDDIHGCNFYMKHVEGYNYIPCLNEYISENLTFDTYHGTYISSIIAAQINNGLGIAGICPNCKIMVLKVTDLYGVSYGVAKYYALEYAVNMGAEIINYSYGSSCPFDETEDIWADVYDLVINTHGVPIVQAAGNEGNFSKDDCLNLCGDNQYCYSNARNQAYYYIDGKSVANKINVASIDSSNKRSSFSVYDGSNSVITIAAPGESIPVSGAVTFSGINGTSYSTPHVSAVLGYLLSRYNKTPTQLKTLITYSADSISTDYNISNRKLNFYDTFYNAQFRFPDTPSYHTFYTFIENLVGDGIVGGYPDGLFRPSRNVTRGEMSKFVKNALEFETYTNCGASFPDVSPGDTFYNYIMTLRCNNVISGYPDGLFRPDRQVTRGEAMKFVINGARKKESNPNLFPIDPSRSFPDVPEDHTFYDWILSANSNGIVSGYPDGLFRPNNNTNRGEMSKMVDNTRIQL